MAVSVQLMLVLVAWAWVAMAVDMVHRTAPLKLQQAADPGPAGPLPPDAPLPIVEDAPVAHDRASLRDGDDLA